MNSRIRPAALGACAAVAAFALDQAMNALAIANAGSLGGGLAVAPGFNLVLHLGSGVSFGMPGDLPPFAPVALAIAIVAWISTLAVQADRLSDAIAYGLIVGGALGNVADRLQFGSVAGFPGFYIGGAHWPAFNLADTAIFCGAAVLLLWPRRHVRRPAIGT